MFHHRQLSLSVVVAVALAALVISGCGSSGKPSYCSQVSSLKQSVQSLTDVNVVTNGTDALKSALQKIQSDAQAVVSSAKSDFPSETSALKTSVNSLEQSVKSLPSSPTAAQIGSVVSDAGATVTAVKNFTSAASSKCG